MWRALLEDERIGALVHCEASLPADLRPFRYPRAQVTAWEDITLFELLVGMLQHALHVYPNAASFFTCSGDGVPLCAAGGFLQGWEQSVLGVPPREVQPAMPGWEQVRQAALADHGLPSMPTRCYGSQWVHLTRKHARCVALLGERHLGQLKAAYRASYAYQQDGHGTGHARMHPDEEFVAYLLCVVGGNPWPTTQRTVMSEKTAEEVKCRACRYRAGHAALLTAGQEAKLAKNGAAQGCVFLRKVAAAGAQLV